MSRATIGLDRAAAIVVGLLLVLIGLAGIVWWIGFFGPWPSRVDPRPVLDTSREPWWPWVAALVGVALILLGVRWLAGHLPSGRVSDVKLSGSGRQGRLTASVGPVASAAAELLGQVPGVRSARGNITEDRGQLIANLTATIDPHVELQSVAAAADAISTELKQVLQRDDLYCRVQFKVAPRGGSSPRVS